MEDSLENDAFEPYETHKRPNSVEQDDAKMVDEEGSKTLIKSFCRHTSGHGFVRIVESSEKVRWIWVAVMISTFIGLIVHLILIMMRYYEYGISTTFYLTPDNQVIMPDITVCPNTRYYFFNKVFSENYTVTPDKSLVHKGTTFQNLYDHYDAIWKLIIGNDTSKTIARHSIVREAYHAGLLRGKFDIILRLNYKNQEVILKDMVLTSPFDSLTCITFRPNIRSLNYSDIEDATVMMLNLFLVGYDDEYEQYTRSADETLASFDGANIYLHSQNTIPNLKTEGHSISRGFMQALLFTQNRMIRQNVNNKCLDNPGKVTVRGLGINEISVYNYSQYVCVDTKKSEQMYRKCGCRSEMLLSSSDIPETVPFCHEIPPELKQKMNNSFTNWKTTTLSSVETLLFDKLKQRLHCHENQLRLLESETYSKICLPKCIEDSYKFDVSSTRMDNQINGFVEVYVATISELIPFVAMDNRSVDVMKMALFYGRRYGLRNCLSILKFVPKYLTVEVIEESLSYPIENFLSDVGGILGLYLGFSVMSMLEIVELFVQLFIHNCIKPKNEKN